MPGVGKLHEQQFPKTFKTHGMFKLHVGAIPDGADVILKLSLKDEISDDELPRVYVNGEKCEFIGREDKNAYTLEPLLCYLVADGARGEYLRPDICSVGGEITVTYIEVKIIPDKA